MSIAEHAEQAKQEIAERSDIRNVWELIAAIIYRFGIGAGAVATLIGILAYGTSVVWQDRMSTQTQLIEANKALVTYLMATAQERSDLAVKTADALAESASAQERANVVAIETARANENLSRAVEQLSMSIKSSVR